MDIKEKLLALKPKIEKVDVPEVGTVWVRGMTAIELDQWVANHAKTDSRDHYHAFLIARTLCDENGKRLFTDEELKKVSTLPSQVADRLWDIAARLSGITKEAEEANRKNSEADQTSASA
jgi:hypothetical protein